MVQAKEGTIEEGSAAWDSLSVTDRTKRKRAAEEKNSKLRSPNFSVSRTRLSVRNIPLTMQEKALKQLFIAAVRFTEETAQTSTNQHELYAALHSFSILCTHDMLGCLSVSMIGNVSPTKWQQLV